MAVSRPTPRVVLACGIALLLCACGQSGALYLPDQQQVEVVSTTTSTGPAQGADEEDEETAARRSDAPAPAGN